MKRFFCDVCMTVKRVQQVPNICSNYAPQYTSELPTDRVGQCNFHQGMIMVGVTRKAFRNDRFDRTERSYASRFKFRHAQGSRAPKPVTTPKKGKK